MPLSFPANHQPPQQLRLFGTGSIYDVADLYKHRTSMPAAFLASRQDPSDDGELVRKLLKQHVEKERILQQLPRDLARLFETDETAPQQADTRPPSAIQ